MDSQKQIEIDWKKRLLQDFSRMKKSGISEIRMGEFSWSTVEPRENVFTPEVFHYALDKAAEYQLDVIFCTPTATPPIWLIEKYPDILPTLENGETVHFGSRRHYDPCNPNFVAYANKITRKFGEYFGSHPAIKLWQIDNEFGHHGSARLYSDYAKTAFQDFLQNKYASIEALNKAWFGNFWSQTYTDFSQIDVPRKTWADQNPHALLDHFRFCTWVYREFQKSQLDIIKSYSQKNEVTHNLISNFYDLCPWEMTKDLDQVGFDHYQDYDYPDPVRSTFNFRLMSSLNADRAAKYFKILEQQPVQVNWQKVNRRFSYDWLLLWAGQSALCGADTISYFSWQKFYGGPEQYHDGVLSHDIRNKLTSQEKLLVATDEMFKHISNSFAVDKIPFPKQDILIIHNTESLWTHRITSQSSFYDTTFQIDEITESLTRLGLGFGFKETIPDLATLKKYKAVIFPGYAFSLTPSENKDIKQYIGSGGVLISYPRSLMKDRDNHMSALPLTVLGDDLFYFEDYGAMGPEETETISLNDGSKMKGYRWAERLVINNSYSTDSLGVFEGGIYDQSSAIISMAEKLGRHVHFSFCPVVCDNYLALLSDLCTPDFLASPSEKLVQVIPLDKNYYGAINFSPQPTNLHLKEKATNIKSYTLSTKLQLDINDLYLDGHNKLFLPARSFTVIKQP